MQKGIYYSFLPGETPEEVFSNAKDIGFDCVEIPTLRTDEERRRYKNAADAVGIRIPSIMNSDHWGVPLSDADPAVRSKGIECLRQSLETAKVVGADTVLLVPGVVKPDVTYEEAWSRSQAEIRRILPEYETAKIYLAIEEVGNKMLLSAPGLARYIDDFASPWVVAYFDVGNIINYGYPEHWVRTLGKRIKKVHVKGWSLQTRFATPDLFGGTIDWPAVMRELHAIGYDDVLTAELSGCGIDKKAKCKSISVDLDALLNL
ncbi:MAG: sugar phosphate isomerase/epimerase [Victivallales bacterium]|nr:sugar phosphate isomerase/epimerase [Victivallales bacterium]